MQLVGIIAVLVIFVIGISQETAFRATPKKSGDVHSANTENTPTLTSTPSPAEPPTTRPTIIVTLIPPTSTPAVNNTNTQSSDLDKFRYPGASMVSSDASSMHLISTDNADAITNWYKSKIKERGYNSTAFAVTNTNGNVLTKLAGANGSTEIRVEITKQSGDVSTQITVTTRTY